MLVTWHGNLGQRAKHLTVFSALTEVKPQNNVTLYIEENEYRKQESQLKVLLQIQLSYCYVYALAFNPRDKH